MSTVKTAGELRSFLLELMSNVASGKTSYERASVAIKGAAQVNESIYAELKAKQLAKSLNEAQHKFGSLPIGDS